MNVTRGEIWLATLDPVRGSEQAGTRPVLVFQNNTLAKHTTTVLTIPLTTNLRRAALPSCIRISKGDGGLTGDSVLLCHQLRVIDKTRLLKRLGTVNQQTLTTVESCVMYTIGIM